MDKGSNFRGYTSCNY